MAYKIKKKYYVTFVPHFERIGDWHGRRLTAYRVEKGKNVDEFPIKKAETIANFLKIRGDKAIKIIEVKS